MSASKKRCGQTHCALAQHFSHWVQCKRVTNPLIEDHAGSAFTSEQDRVMPDGQLTTNDVARAMFNRAILLAQEGYSQDALCCYAALITSFEHHNADTAEVVSGAKHNGRVLERLIFRSHS